MAVSIDAERPLIGVTAYLVPASWGPWQDMNASLVPEEYVTGVTRSGGTPVILPVAATLAAGADSILESIDALVLTGGGDIDPGRYGERAHSETDPPNAVRDEAEFRLLSAARERGMPILAVCRGAQILNILCGGTLRQHLADEDGTSLRTHREEPGSFSRHAVEVRDGSLRTLVGKRLMVSSHHHQGFDLVPPPLRATAFASDGVTEALEDTSQPFCLGVLWHPEQMLDDGGLPLFAGLVDAAKRGRPASGGDSGGKSR